MFKKFWNSRSGNFAIMTGIVLIPVCLSVGVGVDYARHSSAQRHLQEMADATSLALAASREQGVARLEQMAHDYLVANQNLSRVEGLELIEVKATTESIDVIVGGSIPTSFMNLAGYERLDVRASSLAERATRGNVEVSLVLDNTKSMEASGGGGTTRISALKSAASELVNSLLKNGGTSIRIALVPYADNVNVGTSFRGASWVSVPADVTTPTVTAAKAAQPASCQTVTTEQRRTTQNPTYACTKIVDGAEFDSTCGGGWNYETVSIPPKEVCTKATAATPEKTTYSTTTWFGCVGSRIGSTNRLVDGNTSVKYPGFNDKTQKCVTPIVRLTNDKTLLNNSIAGMVTSLPGYAPNTFIPAGLIWGLNTLAPDGPFGDGLAYDDENLKPRKVAVLMTDGSNTLLYHRTTGKAQASAPKLNTSEKQAYREEDCNNDGLDGDDDDNGKGNDKCKGDPVGTDKYAQTNEDTVAICTNMKAKEIEIFTVAFMVEDPTAQDMLKACATSPDHYFEASDSELLSAAFSGIAESLQVVRLAR